MPVLARHSCRSCFVAIVFFVKKLTLMMLAVVCKYVGVCVAVWPFVSCELCTFVSPSEIQFSQISIWVFWSFPNAWKGSKFFGWRFKKQFDAQYYHHFFLYVGVLCFLYPDLCTIHEVQIHKIIHDTFVMEYNIFQILRYYFIPIHKFWQSFVR